MRAHARARTDRGEPASARALPAREQTTNTRNNVARALYLYHIHRCVCRIAMQTAGIDNSSSCLNEEQKTEEADTGNRHGTPQRHSLL